MHRSTKWLYRVHEYIIAYDGLGLQYIDYSVIECYNWKKIDLKNSYKKVGKAVINRQFTIDSLTIRVITCNSYLDAQSSDLTFIIALSTFLYDFLKSAFLHRIIEVIKVCSSGMVEKQSHKALLYMHNASNF